MFCAVNEIFSSQLTRFGGNVSFMLQREREEEIYFYFTSFYVNNILVSSYNIDRRQCNFKCCSHLPVYRSDIERSTPDVFGRVAVDAVLLRRDDCCRCIRLPAPRRRRPRSPRPRPPLRHAAVLPAEPTRLKTWAASSRSTTAAAVARSERRD